MLSIAKFEYLKKPKGKRISKSANINTNLFFFSIWFDKKYVIETDAAIKKTYIGSPHA